MQKHRIEPYLILLSLAPASVLQSPSADRGERTWFECMCQPRNSPKIYLYAKKIYILDIVLKFIIINITHLEAFYMV